MHYFFLIAILPLYLCGRPLSVKTSCDAVVLMNAETGVVLYEKKGHEKMYPASTTKIATALYALQKGEDFAKEVRVERHHLARMSQSVKEARGYRDPPHLLEPDGSSFNLKLGERLTMQDLLHGILLVSGNDAANVIADYLAADIPTFVREMNAYIHSLGAHSTQFVNPHGLHHPEHRTTAFDLALVTKEALKVPQLMSIVGNHQFVRPKTNKQPEKELKTTNHLMRPKKKFYYPKAIGMKTGFTGKAGYCLVAVAEDPSRKLIAVCLKGKERPDRFRDAIALFETAFSEEKVSRLFFRKGENTYSAALQSSKKTVSASLKEDVTLEYFPSEEPHVEAAIQWGELTAPIKAGTVLGHLILKDPHQGILAKSPLFADNDVAKESQVGYLILLGGLILLASWPMHKRRLKKESQAGPSDRDSPE